MYKYIYIAHLWKLVLCAEFRRGQRRPYVCRSLRSVGSRVFARIVAEHLEAAIGFHTHGVEGIGHHPAKREALDYRLTRGFLTLE